MVGAVGTFFASLKVWYPEVMVKKENKNIAKRAARPLPFP